MGKKNDEIENLILSPRNERVAPLWAWLMKHDATCSWHVPVMGLYGDPKRCMAMIECWRVRAGIVLIKTDVHGWSIYSELSDNDIAATLADAEARCMPPTDVSPAVLADIDRCPTCRTPTHASESDDTGRCAACREGRAASIHPDEIAAARKHAESVLLACSIVERCHRAEGANINVDVSTAAVRQLHALRALGTV
jgi:hypothetical protein